MYTEEKIAELLGLRPEMVARVVGDVELFVGADPVGGYIVLTPNVVRVSAVQCEELIRRLTMAKDIVECGVGAMR